MAIKYYLPSAGECYFTSTVGNDFTTTRTGHVPIKLSKVRTNSSFVNISQEEISSNYNSVLLQQYVSDPLVSQTISGTLTIAIKAMESASAANMFLHVTAVVMSPIGVLREWGTSKRDSLELSTSLTNRNLVTLPLSCIAEDGDYFVVSIGYYAENSKTISYTGTIQIGDNSTTDLPLDTSTTSDYNAWVEFSQDLIFKHSVNISQVGNGTITPNIGTYIYSTGDSINLSATPSIGSTFVKWVINGIDDTNINTSIIINSDTTIIAYFDTSYILTINKVGEGIVNPPVGNYSYTSDEIVNLSTGKFMSRVTDSNIDKSDSDGDTEFFVYNNTIYYVGIEMDANRYDQMFLATSNLDGSNFISIVLTDLNKSIDTPNFLIYNNKIYYIWNSTGQYEGISYSQIWIGTSNLDGSNFTHKQVTITNTSKTRSLMYIYNDTIYYVYFENSNIMLASSDLNGDNFNSVQISTGTNLNNSNITIVDNVIYFAWSSSVSVDKHIWLGSSNLDFSNIIYNRISPETGSVLGNTFTVYNGYVYFVWYQIYNTKYQIYFGYSQLDGSNFTYMIQTNSTFNIEYPKFKIVDDTVYYTYIQNSTSDILFTATSNLDGSNFVEFNNHSPIYHISQPRVNIVGNNLYYMYIIDDDTTYKQIYLLVKSINNSFIKWVIDGVDVFNSDTTVAMTKDITATAHFLIESSLPTVTEINWSKNPCNTGETTLLQVSVTE